MLMVAKLKANAAQHADDLRGIVNDIRRSGITTVHGVAEELHSRGIRAPRGDVWHPTAVSRLLARLDWSLSNPEKQRRQMLTITGGLLGGAAVIAVALEATGVAILLGGIAFWLVSHGS
jgi:hypothetical protein